MGGQGLQLQNCVMKTLVDYVKFLLSHSPCRVLRTLYKILYLQILEIIPPLSMVEYSRYRFLLRRHSCHQMIWIASSTKM
jgi:hypothetical protein